MLHLKSSLLANFWHKPTAANCVEMPTSDRREQFYGNIGNGHLGSCRV